MPAPEPERIARRAGRARRAARWCCTAAATELVGVVTALRADGYWQCIDLCGVDYLTHPGRAALPAVGRRRSGSRSSCRCSTTTTAPGCGSGCRSPRPIPTVPTLFFLHPGTEAMEREAFDLFGIVVRGPPRHDPHPAARRWAGHPLRKDYAIGRIPVQFKGAPIGASESP